jgi:hypothetical protein
MPNDHRLDLIDSASADEPLNQAIRGFQELRIPARPDDRGVLAAISTQRPQQATLRSPTGARTGRLAAMLRYGVVAAVLAALVAYGVGQRADNFLLADVADAIARHKTVRFVVEDPKAPAKVPVACYWTLDSMHLRYEGPSDGVRRVMDYPAGRMLILDPKAKTAKLSLFDPKKTNEPKRRLEMYQVIRDERNSKASKETLEGHERLVYRLEKQYGYQDRLSIKTIVWADPATRLPVRIEEFDHLRDLKDPKKFYDDATVNRDFVWDPPEIGSIEEFFSTTPPKGYTVEVLHD